MELRVLGCHGGETPKHRTSSFLVDGTLAVDAGAVTSVLELEEQKKIRSVLVSHAHLDHIRDLATMADNRFQQGGDSIEIAATAGTIDTLKKHFFNDHLWPDFSKILTAKGPTIQYREMKPETEVEVNGYRVRTVSVDHTVEAAAFVINDGKNTIAYSGDTGPTERLWEVLDEQPDLKALLMEVSFPNEQQQVAQASGHHTPDSLQREFKKLKDHSEVPVFLFHIKPVFEAQVEKELAKIKRKDLTIMRLDDRYSF